MWYTVSTHETKLPTYQYTCNYAPAYVHVHMYVVHVRAISGRTQVVCDSSACDFEMRGTVLLRSAVTVPHPAVITLLTMTSSGKGTQ